MTADVKSKIQRDLEFECPKFLGRFSEEPDFAGKTVLEVGCGLGALSVEIADRGAESVTGIDILEEDIDRAKQYVRTERSDLGDKIQFLSTPIQSMTGDQFDVVISKDAFEHILDVPGMLADIRRLLEPGGRLYIGFSPLYHSPYGDHDRRLAAFRSMGLIGRLMAVLPWGHLLFERQILRRHPLTADKPQASMADLNLNKMSVTEFREHVRQAGFSEVSFLANRGNNPVGKLLRLFRGIPIFRNVCTYNVYCVLEPEQG